MIRFYFFLSVFALLPFVSAHGWVKSVTINGKSYPGNEPGGSTNPSIIRQISTISPVKGATNPSLNCGMNATLAQDVASANPGDQLLVWWVGGATGSENWFHETGPIMHYMAQCSGSCASYDSTDAEWFKVSELGVQPDNNSWYQGNLASGVPVNVTIPSKIAPGNYLLRTELISLQNAMSEGGAEFYPACIQLSVGGSGSGTPSSGDECHLPGCYSDTDPGILDPTVYDPPLTYTFPGPPVPTFVGNDVILGGYQPGSSSGGSSSGGYSAGGPSATTTPSSPSPTASASGMPANSDSPSPSATIVPTSTPSPTSHSGSTAGTACYVTPSNPQSLRKRGNLVHKKRKHRLVRRGT